MIRRIGGAVAILALSVACGGDDKFSNTPPPPRDPTAPADPKAAEAAGAADTTGKRKNEDWEKIRVHFLGLANDPATGFVRGTIGTVRDPFEPELVKFVPKIEIPEEDKVDPAATAVTPELPENTPQPVELGETQKFRAQDYKVVLIRWGTSVNKALIQDPEGGTFIVTTDMALGNNQGHIVDITRYEVKVREPSHDEPVVLSIEPDILRIQSDSDGASDRLFTNVTK